MGLRQPSKTGVLFAQAKVGAEQQKQARDRLKKPQALGGSAAAGTQMIAASTEAQQQATQEVKTETESAGKNLVAGNVGTATQTAFAAPSTPAPAVVKVASGESGDVGAVEQSEKDINTNITSLTNQINDLNDKLTNATAADAKAINEEKDRLNKLLQDYQDKLSKGNLGQIAGPSDIEQQLAEREELLASEGQRVAKLASIFGPGWNAQRYGGLASQIYGKDLEALEEQAAAGLEASDLAKRQADVAQEQYTEQLGTSKKAYEESLDTASKKVELLKKTPQELATYTREELTKLFGADVDKLFKFTSSDPKATVTNTNYSATKAALEQAKADQDTELSKVAGEKTKAQTKMEENFNAVDKEITGGGTGSTSDGVPRGGLIASKFNHTDKLIEALGKIGNEINSTINSSFRQNWNGISKDNLIIQGMRDKHAKFAGERMKFLDAINIARKEKNQTKLIQAFKELQNAQNNFYATMRSEASQLSHTGNKKFGPILSGLPGWTGSAALHKYK
jgi:hypothetical protein